MHNVGNNTSVVGMTLPMSLPQHCPCHAHHTTHVTPTTPLMSYPPHHPCHHQAIKSPHPQCRPHHNTHVVPTTTPMSSLPPYSPSPQLLENAVQNTCVRHDKTCVSFCLCHSFLLCYSREVALYCHNSPIVFFSVSSLVCVCVCCVMEQV